jgi:hypothetical protein
VMGYTGGSRLGTLKISLDDLKVVLCSHSFYDLGPDQ